MSDPLVHELARRLDELGYPRTQAPSRWLDGAWAELFMRGLAISFDPEVGDVATHADVLKTLLAPFTRGQEVRVEERWELDDLRLTVAIDVHGDTATISGRYDGRKWLVPVIIAGGFAEGLRRLGHELTLCEDRSIRDQCVHWLLLPDSVVEVLFEGGAFGDHQVVEANLDPEDVFFDRDYDDDEYYGDEEE